MKVSIRVFATNLDSEVFVLDTDAPAEQRLVSSFVDRLKVQFPGNDFQVVKIAKKRYNVIPRPQASA